MRREIGEITRYFSRKPAQEISLEKFEREEKEIEKFILKLEEEGLKEKAFQLDVLLKGLKAFFHLANHPRKTKHTWNMIFEIKCLSDVITHIKSTLFSIHKQGESDIFKNFVESKFKSSLEFLLSYEENKKNWRIKDYFSDFNIFLDKFDTLVDSFARLNYINYREFIVVGDYFLEELVRNRYLYPFVRRNFRVQFHRVVHPEIGKIIKEIEDKKKKYYGGLILVEAFKIFKILELIVADDEKKESVNFFLFVYLRDELSKFRKILDTSENIESVSKIRNELQELEEKVYNLTLVNIFFRKNKKNSYKRALIVYKKSIENIVETVLEEISGEKFYFEAPSSSATKKEKEKLIGIIEEIDKKIDSSLGNVENYKKELLEKLSIFERDYLVYFGLNKWERFYRLYFGIKHSPHKINLVKKIRELKLFVKELKESIEGQ